MPASRAEWSDDWLRHYQDQQERWTSTEPAIEPPPTYKPRNRRDEEELQSAIVKAWRPLLLPGARLLATNGELPGGAEQIPRAARRKAMGYMRGTPDMCCARPGALVWLEIKIKPNGPTTEQEEFGVWAQSCGHGWEVVYSVMAAGEALRRWGMCP